MGTKSQSEIEALLNASRMNDMVSLERILSEPDLADYESELSHALALAIKGRHIGLAKRLLKEDEVKAQAASHDNKPLSLAVDYDDLEILTELLKIPSVCQNASIFNNDILLHAASNGNLAAVKLLLTLDNVRNNAAVMNNKALRYARESGYKDMENLLLTIPEVEHQDQQISFFDEIKKMIDEIVDQRYQNKLDAIEGNYSEKVKAMARIQDEHKREQQLIHTDEFGKPDFDEFYDEFTFQCLEYSPDLTDNEIKEMFFNLLKEIYLTKLKIYDAKQAGGPSSSQISRVIRVEHEANVRVVWTAAQEKATDELRERLDEIFQPMLKDLSPIKIALYTKAGSHRADATGSAMHLDHPPSAMFDEMTGYFGDLLYPHSHDPQSPEYEVDYGLSIMVWNALSIQYVRNTNGKDIDVYLPDGEITTSSIFWNYELNALKRLEMAAGQKGGEIHYHVLTSEAKSNMDSLMQKIKPLQAQLGNIRNEIKALSEKSSLLPDELLRLRS